MKQSAGFDFSCEKIRDAASVLEFFEQDFQDSGDGSCQEHSDNAPDCAEEYQGQQYCDRMQIEGLAHEFRLE